MNSSQSHRTRQLRRHRFRWSDPSQRSSSRRMRQPSKTASFAGMWFLSLGSVRFEEVYDFVVAPVSLLCDKLQR